MSKAAKHRRQAAATVPDSPAPSPAPAGSLEAFSFGDPEPVLNKRDIMDYLECPLVGSKWFEPPVSMEGLARSARAAVHLASPIQVKRNILTSTFVPHQLLSAEKFERLAMEYMIFGNCYLQRVDSWTGKPVELLPSLAKYTRRGADLDTYYFVTGWKQEHEFKKGSVLHLMQASIDQEVYGLPDYIPALQSAWLNESATLFRRKYYLNGSHAGFILYMTDAAQKEEDITALRQALKNAKGPGNFRNLFMYAPTGKKDGIQLIPVGEVAAKDEFLNIKNVTRDDMLAAHRVPPQLMGIIPNNTGGFGDATKAAQVFDANEISYLQKRFLAINEWVGLEVVKFQPYKLAVEATK